MLPKFSGDGGYTKGEVDFETWKYMAETYIDDNYSEGLLKATIIKYLVAEAARHLRSQRDVTVAEIMANLESHYGEVECTSTTWKEVYGATKKRDENVTSWRIRLEQILSKVMKSGQHGREDEMKRQWWTELYSRNW